MKILVADLEGVFLPEIWINVALKTGIEELKLTTRDISDYDVLMTKRLGILKEHKLTLKDIQDVIATLDPLDGAKQMLDWIRERTQIIILSDTFEEFAGPPHGQAGVSGVALPQSHSGWGWKYHRLQPEDRQPENPGGKSAAGTELPCHCLWGFL